MQIAGGQGRDQARGAAADGQGIDAGLTVFKRLMTDRQLCSVTGDHMVIVAGVYETGVNLTHVPCFKINAENAGELSDDLIKIREKYPEGRVVIDTLDLGYISSAGLRVLLNLSKSEKEKPVLINVDASFMDISAYFFFYSSGIFFFYSMSP